MWHFQITLVIAGVAPGILGAILSLPFLNGSLWIVRLISSILGYQAVQRGTAYKYLFSLELIK